MVKANFWTVAVAAALVLTGCATTDNAASGTTGTSASTSGAGPSPEPNKKLTGSLTIDGSSTVYPIATALVEEFGEAQPDVRITANQSGTGAGMQKFGRKEIDIADASRPIKDKEIEDCQKAGVDFVELPVAFDGLSIVVNPKNTWLNSITIAELNKIWAKDSTVKSWKDVNPAWPDKPIKLYGPTTVHGTYEFFNEAVNKDKANSRQDYQQCADYNVLVAGVGKDEGSLGYVGFAYYEQNKTSLKLVPVDGGKGPVSPSEDTIRSGEYTPLSRPLLMYVSKTALDRPEVMAFMEHALDKSSNAVKSQGYITLPDEILTMALDRLKAKTVGSVFKNFKPGMKMDEVLKMEGSK
ncbi:MAG: PstS family phosphate ABC transporter substrate-binding protein [Armatimonadetes bacterium]|nr:PstS family phosphate ABC transporter substrate-binding protein [Armatimonadota bacterium]